MDTQFDIQNLSAGVDEIDLNKEVVRLQELLLNGSESYVILGNSTPKTTDGTDTTSTPVN
jgi:hypothetical protein